MEKNRLEISRLVNRFGFGPKPGEFSANLKAGLKKTQNKLLSIPENDTGLKNIKEPVITDLGPRPKPNSAGVIDFALARRNQQAQLTLWWLDRMVLGNYGLKEKMTWFWHGHWATSINKVDFPLVMYKQNQTLRTNSLGNFKTMSRAMINDGALQIWLDGQTNSVKSPNENLGRELMELFTIGVNRYSEDDVKAAARALTGYQVVRSNGEVTINQRRRDTNPITILGSTNTFTGDSLSDFLVDRPDCENFIAERIWYRFISSTEPMPPDFSGKKAFSSREIYPAITAAAKSDLLANSKYELVKSPVEWFVSACRALEIVPSKLETSERLFNYLDKLGQVPFAPPNVGGWPAEAAWLSSATSLYRIDFANWLIKRSQLQVLKSIPVSNRAVESQNWLGVYQWSERTKSTLNSASSDPAQFALLALCSPEYVVSA
jgi:uncharacterized protein (DUF1800 family)